VCKVVIVKISSDVPAKPDEHGFAVRMHKPPNIPRGETSADFCSVIYVFERVHLLRPKDTFSFEEF